jgi:hypothetical protein
LCDITSHEEFEAKRNFSRKKIGRNKKLGAKKKLGEKKYVTKKNGEQFGSKKNGRNRQNWEQNGQCLEREHK